MSPSTAKVLNLLRGVRGSSERRDWTAFCVGHDDRSQRSLSIRERDGKVILHCFTGCQTADIVKAMGLDWTDLFEPDLDPPRGPAAKPKGPPPTETRRIPYGLTTPAGELVAVHTRIEYSDGSKDYRWSRNGKANLGGMAVADLPLWGLKRLAAYDYTSDPNCTEPYVILCEGEGPALSLCNRGLPAVGTATGAGTAPSPLALSALDGLLLYLWPDNDSAGHRHMDQIARRRSSDWPFVVTWPEAPPKGDAANFGGDAAAVWELLVNAVPWEEPPEPATKSEMPIPSRYGRSL